LYQGI